MRYRVTAIWEEELHERDIVSAREMFELDLRDSMDHLEFEDLRIDLAVLPGQSSFPSTTFPAGSLDAGGLAAKPDPLTDHAYPDDAPPHPWDQGLWIFPDDHPLSRIERRLADANPRGPEREQIQKELLALPPGDDS